MNLPGKRVWLAALLAAGLLLASCQQTEAAPDGAGGSAGGVPPESGLSSGDPEAEVAVEALFQDPDGLAIVSGAACLAAEEARAFFPLDARGEIQVPGLPREGAVDLTLYDGDRREVARTTLHFSTGAVTDAFSGEDGNSYVTTQAETQVVLLLFQVSGTELRCALRLEAESGQGGI